MRKFQNELWNVIAQYAADNMDMKNVREAKFDDTWGYASSMSDEELEEHCKENNIDYLPYLNTGEDI